jgi:hypothetical protein
MQIISPKSRVSERRRRLYLKILNLCIQDPAGAAYALSHALNKYGHQAVSIRANDNYIHYPTISTLRMYEAEGVRNIAEKADVVVFHQAVQPFLTAIGINPKKLKKKLVYFHGSECRAMGRQILEQAQDLLGDVGFLVSTPDLLEIVPEAEWMPVCRSFGEIQSKYAYSKRDQAALESFSEPKRKVILTQASTKIEAKGTPTFYRAITEVVKDASWVEYQPIQNMPWDACLRMIAQSNVMFDSALTGSYGMVSVEASIFRLPSFCRISPNVADLMEKESGCGQPFIQWPDEDGLRTQIFMLCDPTHGPGIRDRFGGLSYKYCKAMHDDMPIVKRFERIVRDLA